MRSKLSIGAILMLMLGMLGLSAPSARAADAPAVQVVWVSEDTGTIKVPTSTSVVYQKLAKSGMATTQSLTATYCGYGQHTQKAIDWFTGATLASHVLRVDFCYNGSSIVGTPVITRHSTSVTLYGSANSITFTVTGQSGPSRINSYSWSAIGYANYCQTYPGYSRCTGRYVMINPQGSGNYGWSEG